MTLYPTDPNEVRNVISSLRSNSAPGKDKITTNVLKACKDLISIPLAFTVNLSYENGIFPNIFKTAVICPIFKSGDKTLPTNYRPISLLSSLSKVFEKLTKKRLMHYIEHNKLLSEKQYGFRAKRSTDDAVLSLTSDIISHVDKNKKCIGVFLDLQKAFDTVSIPILLTRLENIGIRGNALLWFKDYLTDRDQVVKVRNHCSNSCRVNCGVPQGSNLGPSLFLSYVDELSKLELENASIQLFADDTVILFYGDTWEEARTKAENGLRKVTAWLEDSLLTLNINKTKYLCFSKTASNSPNELKLKIHSYPCNRNAYTEVLNCQCPQLERVSYIKYLGVIIDDKLKWDRHVTQVSNRLRKLIYIFKDLRIISDLPLLIQTYKALAECVVSYCISSWGATAKKYMIEAERAQRSVLKVLMCLPYQHPTLLVYEKANVMTVRQFFIYQCIRRYHKTVDPTPTTTRRDNTGNVPLVKSVFASNCYNFQAPRLYSLINDKYKVRSLSNYKLKIILHNWLIGLSYDDTENLLEILE